MITAVKRWRSWTSSATKHLKRDGTARGLQRRRRRMPSVANRSFVAAVECSLSSRVSQPTGFPSGLCCSLTTRHPLPEASCSNASPLRANDTSAREIDKLFKNVLRNLSRFAAASVSCHYHNLHAGVVEKTNLTKGEVDLPCVSSLFGEHAVRREYS